MKLITHNGLFHADDAFSSAVLLTLYPENVRLVRTRDTKEWEEIPTNPYDQMTGVLVYDVGDVYAPDKGRFDHHQSNKPHRPSGIPYSSFGLIWKEFGHLYIVKMIDQVLKVPMIDEIWSVMDQRFVEPIDAADNGHAIYTLKEAISPYTISDMVHDMNPTWDSEEDFDEAFQKAVAFAQQTLKRVLQRVFSELKAQDYVRAKATEKIVVLDKGVPWRSILPETEAMFVVYPSPTDTWMCQVVPVEPTTNTAKKDLPKEWGGLRDEALQRVTGVSDAVFCHTGLFLCGAKSKEGAITLARKALEA